MSRYCGDVDPAPIFRAAEHWCTQALSTDGSVLSDKSLWRLEHLEAIDRYYVNNIDETDRTFFEKLEEQLAPTTPEAKELVAEMLWVMLLCPSNISAEKKQEDVNLVWNWSGQVLPGDLQWLGTQVLKGIGSAGQSFSYNRWRELIFFVRLMLALKRLDPSNRDRLLHDGWAFAEWLRGIPEEGSRQLRHMILYLLFPDQFERVFAGTDRRQIVLSFTEKSKGEVDSLSPTEIDRELLQIRTTQEEKYGTKELDFYLPPLIGLWKGGGFGEFTKDIQRKHVLKALEEINRTGVPPDARSTTYDLIEGQHRFPPKLVLSLASKYASGVEFDRSLFSGGEASPAFALLRKLNFHIERKDFVESLISRFLKQAEAADDLSTKTYPKTYRGLHVAVSFGQGNFNKVPWISFLGYGQKTSEGIYPVYLFYRETGILILAYGISETKPPAHEWNNTEEASTIRRFLSSHYGKTPERYGGSLVCAAYRVPDDIDGARLTSDLDRLIAKYDAQLGPVAGSDDHKTIPQPVIPEVPEDAASHSIPYTIADALKDLFLDEVQLKSILDLWERKKNVILQGPPGVGKTFVCRRLAYALIHEKAPDRVEAVQFHQTYAYEDFVRGTDQARLDFSDVTDSFISFASVLATIKNMHMYSSLMRSIAVI